MAESSSVAAVQMCSGTEPDANIATITELATRAADQGADYVLTPEVSVAFAANRDGLKGVALPYPDNPHLAQLADLARQLEVFLHVGSLAIAAEDGKYLNRSVLFAPDGAVAAIYDKIHLFDADPPDDRPYRESATYLAGQKAVVTDAPGFRLGMSICYDVRFPALYRALGEAGAQLVSIPAAFTVPTGRAHWEVLVRSRAIETGSYAIAAAQGGQHANGRATWGRSMIVDPWGKIIAQIDGDEPGVIMARIDPEAVAQARARLPALANARPFSLSVNQDLSS